MIPNINWTAARLALRRLTPRKRMLGKLALGGLALGLLAGCAPRQAAAPDYRSAQVWLCRPDQSGLCQTDLDATRITPDGTRTRETWQADPQATVGCFYVYPTASWDFASNADLRPGGEADVTRQQAARFSSVCQVYAPLYRQNTIPALLGLRQSGAELAYQDVKAAWQTYLRGNNGRPFVLIGHSQGSYHLIRLLAQEIEPNAALRSRLVSALLLGAPVSVPRGQDVGGSFEYVPLCRAADQTGCAVSYSAFAARVPLPEPGDSPAFGRVPAAAHGQPEQRAACVNPAALTGGRATLHPYFMTERTFPLLTAVQRRPAPWTTDGAAIDTPFVTLPDFVTGECTERGGVSFLEIRVTPHPGSPRTTDLGGTVNVAGRDLRAWGLHLIDVDLAQGDLIGLVKTQTAAWLAQPRP